MVDGVFDTKKHTNVKRKAQYRRIDKYIKSLAKMKAEQARRMRVLELWIEGYKIWQIALELGVSKRTVNRDLKTQKCMIERRFKRSIGSLAELERQRILKQLDGLSLIEQAGWIRKYIEGRKAVGRCRRRCRKLLVIVDADAAVKGQNALKLKPKLPALVAPYVINFQLIVEGKREFIGQVGVG